MGLLRGRWKSASSVNTGPDLKRVRLLGEGDVHLWLADLDKRGPNVHPASTLSAEELARAKRYVHARDRDRFASGRVLLRRLVGAYLDMPPEEVAIRIGPNGKPYLLNSGAGTPYFNFSRSGKIALYAFSAKHEVGVDIERVQHSQDVRALADVILTDQERAHFYAAPSSEQTRLLYRYWTCKEAVIKAAGGTLSEMHQVAVPLNRCEPSGWMRVRTCSVGQPRSWALRELIPLAGYVAALAIESFDTPLQPVLYSTCT